jgi:hypothetical protein
MLRKQVVAHLVVAVGKLLFDSAGAGRITVEISGIASRPPRKRYPVAEDRSIAPPDDRHVINAGGPYSLSLCRGLVAPRSWLSFDLCHRRSYAGFRHWMNGKAQIRPLRHRGDRQQVVGKSRLGDLVLKSPP